MSLLNAAQDQEVTFLSGINADGTVAATSFWTWDNNNPATYTSTSLEAKWGQPQAGTPGGIVTYAFDPASHWTSSEEFAFSTAFALWSAESNISFVQVSSASGGNIDISRASDGTASGGITSLTPGAIGGGTLGQAQHATISIDTSTPGFGPLGSTFQDYGGYPWETLLHEIGHAIGLGHSGAYNETVNPPSQQFGAYDDRLFSLMSYINPWNFNPSMAPPVPLAVSWGASSGDNGLSYLDEPITPMALDIAAIQRIYGAPTSGPLSSGGQVFGFNTNIAGPVEAFFDFTKNLLPIITLYDAGANNTLDLSGYGSNSTVDLHQGSFSSCAGLTENLCIAFGTRIDTVIGGSGNDNITANDDGDTLIAGSGNDRLMGGAGADSIHAGSGADTVTGGGGADNLYAGAGRAAFVFSAASDSTAVASDHIFGFKTGQDSIAVNFTDSVTLVRDHGSTLIEATAGGVAFQAEVVGVALNGDDLPFGTHLTMIADDLGDIMKGSEFGDVIQGGAGNDVLLGSGGGDAFYGGGGADRFVFTSVRESDPFQPSAIFDFQTGVDSIDLSLLDQAEGLQNVSLVRSGGSTFLFANTSKDHLTGQFQLNSVGHDINGNDIVTGEHFGIYLIGDNGGDTLIGSANGDPIQGGTGNDTIIGGAGADALFSGGGSDTFVYQAYSDSPSNAGDGIFGFVTAQDVVDLTALNTTNVSLVRSGGSTFLFADGAGPNDHLQITFINGLVNGNDILTGSTHGVFLIGDDSGDTLIGSANGDPIQGGSGNDIIIGGGGGDALFGGAGSNTFKYVAASDSTTTAPDSIFDFVSGKDKIDLSAVRESATDAFGVLNQAGSTFIFVHLDPGQADAHDMTIILNGTQSITTSDIIWGTAPSHEIGVSSAHASEIAPVPVSSGDASVAVSHALLDGGNFAASAVFMPVAMHQIDPLDHYFLGPLNQHVAELLA